MRESIWNRLIGHLTMIILLIMAIVYYKERTIFADTALGLYNMIHYHGFTIEASRYSALLTKLLPFIAIHLHLPLKMVLVAYSMSFVLIYYLVFIIIAHGYKNDRIALSIPLILVTGIQFSYFWIFTETQQALVYNILFFSAIQYMQKNEGGKNHWQGIIPPLLFLILSFFSHPISLLTIIFLIGFQLFDARVLNDWRIYLLVVVVILLAVVKGYLIKSGGGYEDAQISLISKSFDKLTAIFQSETLKFLTEKLFSLYLFPFIIFLLTVFFSFREGNIKGMMYVLTSLFVFLVIIIGTFMDWYIPFIVEKNLMPMNLLILIPFISMFPKSGKKMHHFLPLTVLILFSYGIFNILQATPFQEKRLEYLSKMIQGAKKYQERKLIVYESILDAKILQPFWSTATETLLLSSLPGPDSSCTIFPYNELQNMKELNDITDPDLFLCVPFEYGRWTIGDMDSDYFNLGRLGYRELTEEDIYSSGDSIHILSLDFQSGNDTGETGNIKQEEDGNNYFESNDEFSSGYAEPYNNINVTGRIFLKASVSVKPLEPINPGSLRLVIALVENGQNIEYFISERFKADSLSLGSWNRLSAGGILPTPSGNAVLKVYVWNPERKRYCLDDFIANYYPE